jgi:hypothetical protein
MIRDRPRIHFGRKRKLICGRNRNENENERWLGAENENETVGRNQWRIHGRGRGYASPLNLVRRGRPSICPPRFHSTIVVDIPLERYRAIEYSATFDDIRPIYNLSAV